jgi:hypothetical protein
MAYHITKIINNSSKTVLLTNPKAERDTHLVPKNNSLSPPNPPLVESIRESNVSYETAVTKALNIYTMQNNWCFWDNGSSTALVGLADGGQTYTTFPTQNATELELTIDAEGVPSFPHSRLSLRVKGQEAENSN